MNKIKKIVCLVLAAVTVFSVCAVFASCEKRKSGKLLATYSGGEIYESDVADWQNYFCITNASEIVNAEDSMAKKAEVLDTATGYFAHVKMFRALLAEKNIATITDKMIKEYAENVLIPALNEQYESNGGYVAWRNMYSVSKNFIYDYAEQELVNSYREKYIMENYGVTDDMITEYWNTYAAKYVVLPSYLIDVIMVQVPAKDKTDPEAWEAAKAEAQGYIDRIKAGEDFSAVKAEAIEKSSDPTSTKAYSVEDSVPYRDCTGFEDIEENMKSINELVEEYKKKYDVDLVEYADKNSGRTYNLWFSYCNMLNELYTKNALPKLEIGETVSEPIRHLEGYEIIKLTGKRDDAEFRNPKTDESVYYEIHDLLYSELWGDGTGAAVQAFELQLEEDYKLVINYAYADNVSSES